MDGIRYIPQAERGTWERRRPRLPWERGRLARIVETQCLASLCVRAARAPKVENENCNACQKN